MALELAGPVSGLFFAGNDRDWEFTVTQNGAAVDISGATGKFTMSRYAGATAVLSTEAPLSNVTASLSDAANGEFTITATDTATADLLGTYLYQAQIIDATGDKSNVLHGYFTFKQNIVP